MGLLDGINGVAGTMGQAVRMGKDLGLSAGIAPGAALSWRDQLRPASFRGIRFGVLAADTQFGRRNAVHEYPYRDTVWVEDMGRQARAIRLIGFIVGDNVIQQRERLIARCEEPGDGELVHPSLGRLTVSLMSVRTTERWDLGRVIELHFFFIEAGEREFPALTTATGDKVRSAANAADAAASDDFATRAYKALVNGAATVRQATDTAARWARKAQRLVNDATNLYNAAKSLPGTFGRYYGGKRRRGIDNFLAGITGTSGALRRLVGLGTVSRRHISSTASDLTGKASGLGA